MRSLLKHTCLSIILLGLASLSLNCQHVNAEKVVNRQSTVENDKFSIAAPAGWKPSTQEEKGFKIQFLMAPRVDNFSPNLNIITEYTNGLSKDEYIRSGVEKMRNSGMIKNGSGTFEANGLKGNYITSLYTYQRRNMAIKSYMLFKNGLAYVLTGTCLVSQKNTYWPIFDRTVNTFKIK